MDDMRRWDVVRHVRSVRRIEALWKCGLGFLSCESFCDAHGVGSLDDPATDDADLGVMLPFLIEERAHFAERLHDAGFVEAPCAYWEPAESGYGDFVLGERLAPCPPVGEG